MIARLVRFHLRWFGIFAFVGTLLIMSSHMQDGGIDAFKRPSFTSGLAQMAAVCAALSVAVPWLTYLVDPRRTGSRALADFLAYWKIG
jgi:hypothetical protein